MANELFSKKSMDKVSSPEELNDYIKVSNPGIWMILAGIVVLLIGVCVWGVTGHLDTVVKAGAESRDGTVTCYIKESDIDSINEGMTAVIDGREYKISSVSSSPQQLDENVDAYILHMGKLEAGEWIYTATIEASVTDGVYEAEIVTESVSPMSFILN